MRRSTPSSRPTTRTRFAAGLALLSIGAAACGQAAAAPAATDSAAAAELEYESPLATFLGVDFDAEDQQDVYLAQERDRIDWVTKCMAEQGFEYRETDPAEYMNASNPNAGGPEWGTDEWVATYGFGISTTMFDQATVGSDLVGYESDSSYDYVDPNEEYLDTLSDEERMAYQDALYGNNSYEWDPSMSDEENSAAADEYFENLEPTGCANMSYEMTSSGNPYERVYDVFGDELNAMYERMEADPEIKSALAEMSRCASAKGYNFTDEQATQEDIYRRLDPVQAAVTWPGHDLTEDEWEAMTDEQLREMENQLPTMTSEGKALLAEIQQYEIELATAVHECGYGDMQSLYMKVMQRHEQQFVDSHRAELESLLDS